MDSNEDTHMEVDSFDSKVSDFVKNIYHATLANEAAQFLIGSAAKDS